MMCLFSCKTTTIVEKTIYKVPKINWPEFPELGEYEKTGNGKIATDEDYFRRLLIFRTLYFDEIEKYEEKRKFLKEENENEERM